MSKEKNDNDRNMILVEAGRFEMGEKSEVKHITITNDFYICKYSVTFAEYDRFCNKRFKEKPNDGGWRRRDRPVINITWYEAIEYCNWLSRVEGKEEVYKIKKSFKDINNDNEEDELNWTITCDFDKNGYRLPTEAEWEFAARGGNGSKGFKYSGSNDLNKVAWYMDNSKGRVRSIGKKKANELGIYDLSGNIYEWCWDWYSFFYDTKGTKKGSYRVGRGGSWNSNELNCKATFRFNVTPSRRFSIIGFRVTRTC